MADAGRLVESGMDASNAQPSLVFSGIRLDPDAIALLERGEVAKRVPRVDVVGLELRHGFLSRHPFVQMVFGVGVIWLGHFPVDTLIRRFREGDATLDIVILGTVLVPLGIWLIYDAFERGHYLDMRTRVEGMRFPLSGRPTRDDVQGFLSTARADYGYDILDRT
jgi:hypothetical protein